MVRHQKASKMLIFSDLSVEQIAEELGYPNRHYFSRVFAQNTGFGPVTFRKRHEKSVRS
jgi:YesN/AraC family two-component response regulator